MSFFGFNTSGPPGHNASAPGFSQAHDPFAGLSNRNEDDEALEFDDTYDGLGDQLEESGDAFNDDTFGDSGGAAGTTKVGKDFDFFGQTAQVAGAIDEEALRFNRQHPVARAGPPVQQPGPVASNYHYGGASMPKPARSGYEKYNEESDLQVDASLWGVAPKKPAPAPTQAAAAPARKMMSLEEVEAAMRSQSKPAPPAAQHASLPAPQQAQPQVSPSIPQQQPGYGYAPQQQQQPPQQAPGQFGNQHHGHGHPIQILQRPQSKQGPAATAPSPAAHQPQQQQARQQPAAPVQPTQILQNPNRMSGDASRHAAQGRPAQPTHRQQGSINLTHLLQHPSQLQHLTEDQKQAQLEQEAKRAKRNHKIFLLSKDNGVMTPQDKNFITRIQLQQLVAATGNPNEHGTDESLNEDFYYQVHSQIRGGQRQNPNQPLSNFAQTYLHQTGGRQPGMRRHNRGPENHMQRMEQQVQRAVEAAKNKPKNKQLVIEGSLGKISFSNAKTPKPLLNIKRSDSTQKASPVSTATMDRKTVLRDIEKVYTTLMKMEDHERRMPPPPADDSDLDLMQANVEWREEVERLNQKLWNELKVHEPIGETPIHPFIAFLSFPKGKKALNRVFRHASHQQRTTILTMIIYNIEQLDVIRGAQVNDEQVHLNASMREAIEMFSATVMMSLFSFMSELDLDLTTAVMGLICNKDVDYIARTRVGAAILTMILSRAEIIKQSGGATDQAWQTWENMYTNLFNIIEPSLPNIFPATVTSGEDMYVWQLLAAMGIGANPDQQQRLVLAVKDRVMNTVGVAKTLPAELSAQRLGNVNLFMRSIGLDVELLQ